MTSFNPNYLPNTVTLLGFQHTYLGAHKLAVCNTFLPIILLEMWG